MSILQQIVYTVILGLQESNGTISVLTEPMHWWCDNRQLNHDKLANTYYGAWTQWSTGLHSQCNRYCNYAIGWTSRDPNPGRAKRFVSARNPLDRFWNPPNLLLNGYRVPSREQSGLTVKTTHFHLLPRL